MSNFTMADKEETTSDYILLQDDAVRVLQEKYKNKKGSARNKVDIYLYSHDKEIPTQVYVATSWKGEEFPFPILTLPEKRYGEIIRGMVVLFNRDLTRYAMVKPKSVKGLAPVNGKIEIPLNRVEFFKV